MTDLSFTLSSIMMLLVGAAALLFGRRLFWLFTAISGFAISFSLVNELFVSRPEWVVLIMALFVGLIGALLALYVPYAIAAVAAFFAGGYAFVSMVRLVEINSPTVEWIVAIIGGIIGAMLVLALFDWAIVILAASTGASILVPLFGITGGVGLLLYLILWGIGIGFQALDLTAPEPTYEPMMQPTRMRRVVRSNEVA